METSDQPGCPLFSPHLDSNPDWLRGAKHKTGLILGVRPGPSRCRAQGPLACIAGADYPLGDEIKA